MFLTRTLAVWKARNREFWRDKASLGWGLLFPILMLVGFGFIFDGGPQPVFKIGLIGETPEPGGPLARFLETPELEFVPVASLEEGMRKIGQHRYDLLLDPGTTATPARYWINGGSSKGAMARRVLLGSDPPADLTMETVNGRELRYVDWFFPGLLGMNIMFAALIGVGFVIVRYRKNGVLRRLKATPLSAFEFLTAQVASRMLLVMAITLMVYVGALGMLDIQMLGSHLLLFLVFGVGAFCLIALGVVISARTASEELAGGLLNLMTWPMMILSDVWFSLEGAPAWVRSIAELLPLTHLNRAAREVMIDGAGFSAIAPELVLLAGSSLLFLTVGAFLFRWE